MKQSTCALLLAAILALAWVPAIHSSPLNAVPTQGRRLLKGGGGGGGGGTKGGAEFEAPEIENENEDEAGHGNWDDNKTGTGVTYTREDYEKAEKKKGDDDKAPTPGPGPAGPGPAGPGPAGPGPVGPGPNGTPPSGTPNGDKGDDKPKSPSSPTLPLGPSGGVVEPVAGACVLRGRKYRVCFKLDEGVIVYFTLKEKKLQAAFSAAKSGNWAAFLLGDVNGANPAVLAQTCGKECAKAKGTVAQGGYALANYTGKSKVKFEGVKAWLTADGTYQVPFQFTFPKGEKAIKVSVVRDNGAGSTITKVILVTKDALLA